MKYCKFAVVAAAAFFTTGAVHAADAEKAKGLLKGSDCLACHAEATKLVGPAYKEVAKKYKGNAAAVDMLVKKIKAGGSGVWGAIPMTPHPNLKDDDVKTMVEYILSLS